MRVLSNKFKVEKPVNLFAELQTDSMNDTTSRKIYGGDYALLRKMAYYKDMTIMSLIVDILLECEPILVNFRYDELPKVMRPAYATNNHKSIRMPVKYIQFLDDHAGESDKPIKELISSCIRYYRDHCLPEHLIELMKLEEQRFNEQFIKDIK